MDASDGSEPAGSPFVEFYPTSDEFDGNVPLIPASRERDWFHPGFHHCLPLQIANQLGWTLVSPADFAVFWSGKDRSDAIVTRGAARGVVSHFGYGIFSYVPPFVLKTSKGVGLLVKAVPNQPKDGICALEGLVETDNLKGRFTFNFRITRPNCWITFRKGEPLAQILPFQRTWLQSFDVRTVIDGPNHESVLSTTRELEKLRSDLARTSRTPSEQRDHLYLRGRNADGSSYDEHLRSVAVRPFPRTARAASAPAPALHLTKTESATPVSARSETGTATSPSTILEPAKHYGTVPEFFPQARAMRDAFDAHFGSPHEHRAETHEVWNYWHAPPLYTYVRTTPEKVLNQQLATAFVQRITRWSIQNLGLSKVSRPWLSFYVNGCRQGVHNDVRNGRLAYVFSLTHWERRRFEGGETLIFPPEAYWGSARMRSASAGRALYDVVEPRFNQLLVFDDRLMHAVQTVVGTNDPREGRVVLTGHLEEGSIVVDGPLSHDVVAARLAELRPSIERDIEERYGRFSGLLTVRLDVDVTGCVGHAVPLLELFDSDSSGAAVQSPASLVIERLGAQRFEGAVAPTSIYIPFRFLKA